MTKYLILIPLVIIIGLWGFFRSLIHSVGDEELTFFNEELIIPQGMTAYGLHDKLDLHSPVWVYKYWLKKNYPDFSLGAGTYPIRRTITVDDLFGEVLLYEPQARDISITILPGWHIGEVENHLKTKFRDRVDELNLVDMNSQLVLDFRAQYPFLGYSDSLEGFLYPDTYRIYPDATLRDMVEVMLQRFDEKIYSEYANETGDMDFYDTLILASILEEEEKSTENKPTVAGILKKRLDEGWALGTDITVCYPELITGDKCQAYVNEYYSLGDAARFARKNLYDTRRFLGLPDTPISSVSVGTFDAVVNSVQSEYYYYLHDKEGVIRYGRDAQEHSQNKLKYLY